VAEPQAAPCCMKFRILSVHFAFSPAVTLSHFFESPDIHVNSRQNSRKTFCTERHFCELATVDQKFKVFAVFREERKVSLTKFCATHHPRRHNRGYVGIGKGKGFPSDGNRGTRRRWGLAPKLLRARLLRPPSKKKKHFKVVLPAKNCFSKRLATATVDQKIEKSDLLSQATFFVQVACGGNGTQAPYRWILASSQEE